MELSGDSHFRLFLNSLQLMFLHITDYRLDYTWRIRNTRISHAVIWFLEEGEIRFSVNDTQYQAKAGQFIFLPPDSNIVAHAVSSRIGIISINFDVELRLASGRNWSDILRLPVLNVEHDRSVIEPVIRTMLKDSQENTFAQRLLLQSGFERLFALMLNDYYQSDRVDVLPGLDPRVRSVVEYVSLHPNYSGDVSELCRIFQVSESYLRKLFMDELGMPPLTYIHQFKIADAQRRLITGMDKVSEIADSLGFQDANYFSRLFKKKTGCTPNEYRKKLRNWMNETNSSYMQKNLQNH